jgi:chromosomal replication initiator protein
LVFPPLFLINSILGILWVDIVWKTCKYLDAAYPQIFRKIQGLTYQFIVSKLNYFKLMNTEELWKTICSDLELSISHSNYMTWIRPAKIIHIQQVDVGKQKIEISCPSPYHKQHLEERYIDQITEVFDRVTKLKNSVSFIVGLQQTSQQQSGDGPLFQPASLKLNQLDYYHESVVRARLREDFIFTTFAVSNSNEMAYAAAQAVAKTPGIAYNPLYLYGGVGVGKTHLTQAIGHSVLKQKPDAVVIYCTGEEFTNEIIDAIRRKQTHPFKKKYRSADLLIIDDIQFIAGKSTVQEEFFHTFNAIQQEGGQIILVSDQPPHAIDGLEDRLRSRFEGGLIIDIQQPNFELRTAILLIKAKRLNLNLPMNIAQLIAANIESARRLEGFLTRLSTELKLRNQDLSESIVRGLLGLVQERDIKILPSIRPKEAIKVISKHFNIPQNLLIGPSRLQSLVFPRHIAMYIFRIELQLPLEEIGVLFGGRDHTTVMHAINKISRSLSTNERLRIELSTIRKKIYG